MLCDKWVIVKRVDLVNGTLSWVDKLIFIAFSQDRCASLLDSILIWGEIHEKSTKFCLNRQ